HRSFKVFGLVLYPLDEVVVLAGASGFQDVKVVVPATSSIDVDELLVVGGKLDPKVRSTSFQSF
ncbi:hypothetical protein ACFQ6Q_34350, partial [Streptomyces sp. NPDC056437]|uniref:hypothetical protein n=1 Tax=Streptomyces sp. NPDC056437 TaxID=3345816 RepID=UPI003699174D